VGVLDASTSPPKERYAVSKDTIIKLIQPGNVEDPSIPLRRVKTLAYLKGDDETIHVASCRMDLPAKIGKP